MKTVLVALVITTNWITFGDPVLMVQSTNCPQNKFSVYVYEEKPIEEMDRYTNVNHYVSVKYIEKQVVETNYLPVVEMEVPNE